jgi:hypothetical protein
VSSSRCSAKSAPTGSIPDEKFESIADSLFQIPAGCSKAAVQGSSVCVRFESGTGPNHCESGPRRSNVRCRCMTGRRSAMPELRLGAITRHSLPVGHTNRCAMSSATVRHSGRPTSRYLRHQETQRQS